MRFAQTTGMLSETLQTKNFRPYGRLHRSPRSVQYLAQCQLRARYGMELGINADDGSLVTPNFRYSYVGLRGDWGTFNMGRLDSSAPTGFSSTSTSSRDASDRMSSADSALMISAGRICPKSCASA